MATTSQIATIAAKHRCDCYSSTTTSFLYGLRREGPPTERTTLERLLNILSRAAISDSKNPQRIWSQQPDWWHLCTPLPWKNPREHPKDRKDALKKKVEILQEQLQLRGLLTKELKEEWLLYKGSTKTDLERKSDFEAIIAKSSGLHHMLDRVRDKVNSACLLSDKVAEYICQLKACLEKSLREVSAMACLVEEKERGKKKLWDQMGVCQPAKRLKVFNGGNLTILSSEDHVDDVLELSPLLLMSNMESDPLPSPSTEQEAIDYPSLENLAEKNAEHALNFEVTLNSASYMNDINQTGKRRLGHVPSASAVSDDGESFISAQEVSCKETERYSSGPTATKEIKELKLVSRDKIAEPSKCQSSDVIVTSSEKLPTSLNVSVTSPDVPIDTSNIPIASPTIKSLNVPTASSEVATTSHSMHSTSPTVSVTSSNMLRIRAPSFSGLSARDIRLTPSNHVRRKSEAGLAERRSPPFPRHLIPVLRQTTEPLPPPQPNFLDIPSSFFSRSPDVHHAAKRGSTPTNVQASQRRTGLHRAPPTASTRVTDRETELAVSAILVPEADQEEIIVADDDILNEVEEIIAESPAPTVHMYVESVDNNDDDLQKSVTDSYGQVAYEDILPSVEGVIMAGLSEGASGGATILEDCKIPRFLLPLSSYSVSQRFFGSSPNALSVDIGREVIP